MPLLKAQSVDAVICDPPYGTTACAWDSVIPFEPMWNGIKHVAKERAAIALFGSQPFTSALIMSNPKMFRHEWNWEKDKGANFLQANFQPIKVHENVTVFAQGKTTYNPQKTYNTKKQKRRNALQKYQTRKNAGLTVERFMSSASYEEEKLMPRSIIYFHRDNMLGGALHPTQKSVALMEYLIKTYTNERETVLDFTFGSGTTGLACIRNNRYFIGVERDEKYFEIAAKRLEDCAAQGMLDFSEETDNEPASPTDHQQHDLSPLLNATP